MSIHVSNALGEFDFTAIMVSGGGGTTVEANPEMSGDEDGLTSIEIDDTKYKIEGGVTSVAGKTGAVTLTKSDVGLNNVDNTSDADKPISTATQAALNEKQASLVSGTNIKTINGSSILGSGDLAVDAAGVQYTATAPTVANTDGNLKFVVLEQEPATKYDGYIYLIKEPGE